MPACCSSSPLTLGVDHRMENAETLWGFIGRYRPGVTPKTHPKLDAMVGYAIRYYRDFRWRRFGPVP